MTVGVLNALYKHIGRDVSPDHLAEGACEIEIDKLGEPIGRQDQYAAAFGGMNRISFNPDGVQVSLSPSHETWWNGWSVNLA